MKKDWTNRKTCGHVFFFLFSANICNVYKFVQCFFCFFAISPCLSCIILKIFSSKAEKKKKKSYGYIGSPKSVLVREKINNNTFFIFIFYNKTNSFYLLFFFHNVHFSVMSDFCCLKVFKKNKGGVILT